MSILKILTIIFFIITVVLFIKSKKIGRAYIPYGLLTFIFVLLYGYYPSINEGMIGLYTFIFFSMFALLCGLTSGIIGKLCFKYDKNLNIVSVIASLVVICLLVKGVNIISYMFIPVLLLKWESIIGLNKTNKKR